MPNRIKAKHLDTKGYSVLNIYASPPLWMCIVLLNRRDAVSIEPPSTPWHRATLPADITPFVGRRAERAEVRRLLSASRMVTITGAGGVGKSRLALQTARD